MNRWFFNAKTYNILYNRHIIMTYQGWNYGTDRGVIHFSTK